jgi:glycine betaine/proline transport system ATP-binding protein
MSAEQVRGSVRIDNVSIIFGDNTEESLALADAGKSRAEIQEQTGDVLGVHNCTVDINEGEILVLMGLSGSGKSTLAARHQQAQSDQPRQTHRQLRR